MIAKKIVLLEDDPTRQTKNKGTTQDEDKALKK